MSKSKIVALPAHIIAPADGILPPYDSCFIPRGFLFPESREEFAPFREFPLSDPFYSAPVKKSQDISRSDIFASDESQNNDFDSTILQISELDELLLDVQAMGMQYTMHTQMCLRGDLRYEFPRMWDKKQSLLVNIPVFSEELCLWHYPISTLGYNIANTDAPLDLDIARNYPQLFGYLPNGDILLYWKIADALSQVFHLDLEPVHTTVDGSLVLMPGVSEETKSHAPCGAVVETGIVVAEDARLPEALAFARSCLGYEPVVIESALYHFRRLVLPIIHCELDYNVYAEATWGAFGFTSPRLTGFDFKMLNNPFARELPIFATERGNIVASNDFYARLRELVLQYGGNFCTLPFPVQRIQ